jgi:FAD/FMN-containing dehydrogenase
LEEGTLAMREIIEEHGIKTYTQQLFPQASGSEHVSLLFHHPDDKEEYAKVQEALPVIMQKALDLGGVPYTKGRQWSSLLRPHMADTGYWNLFKTFKQAIDPNGIMNTEIFGF